MTPRSIVSVGTRDDLGDRALAVVSNDQVRLALTSLCHKLQVSNQKKALQRGSLTNIRRIIDTTVLNVGSNFVRSSCGPSVIERMGERRLTVTWKEVSKVISSAEF